MKHERIRQILELLMEIVWIVINKKRSRADENSDNNGRPHGDL